MRWGQAREWRVGRGRRCVGGRARISHLRLGALVLEQPDEAGDGLGAPLDELDARRVVVEGHVGGGDALGFVEGHLRLQSVLDEVELARGGGEEGEVSWRWMEWWMW